MENAVTQTINVQQRKFVEVTVTNDPAVIYSWLEETSSFRNNRIVGLDTKWRHDVRDQETSLLQLCFNTECLVLQLRHCPGIPQSIREILESKCYIFVGVDIAKKVEKLRKEYGIRCSYVCDVRELAMRQWPDQFYTRPELKDIAFVADGIVIPKLPEDFDWESRFFDEELVKYAGFEAYACYRIGERLFEDGKSADFGSLVPKV